jgi:FtsZ-binding cell division protein ZapB
MYTGCCFKHVVARFGSDSTGICSIFEYIHVQRLFSDMAGKALMNFPHLKRTWFPARLSFLIHDQLPDSEANHKFLRSCRPHFYRFMSTVFTLPNIPEFSLGGRLYSLVCHYMAVFLRDWPKFLNDVGSTDIVVIHFRKVCYDYHFREEDLIYMSDHVKKDYVRRNLCNEKQPPASRSTEVMMDCHMKMLQTALDDISKLSLEVHQMNVTNTSLREKANQAITENKLLKTTVRKLSEDLKEAQRQVHLTPITGALPSPSRRSSGPRSLIMDGSPSSSTTTHRYGKIG